MVNLKAAPSGYTKTGNPKGLHFWARGYCVSTIGLDEESIRKYIREQEKNDSQMDFDFE